MDVKSGTFSQPEADLLVFVRRVVVKNEMDVKLCRDIGLNVAQKLKELLVSMPLLALGYDIAGTDVQSSEEGRSSVAEVIVGIAFQVTQTQGEGRLRTFQRLALALFVNA